MLFYPVFSYALVENDIWNHWYLFKITLLDKNISTLKNKGHETESKIQFKCIPSFPLIFSPLALFTKT